RPVSPDPPVARVGAESRLTGPVTCEPLREPEYRAGTSHERIGSHRDSSKRTRASRLEYHAERSAEGALMTRRSPWPKGARCAVMLTFDFDAETLWLARDPKTADLPGVMSQGRYGARVGVPRLLRLLRAEGVRATFYIPGWVAEHHTAEARAIRDAGHEIGHH